MVTKRDVFLLRVIFVLCMITAYLHANAQGVTPSHNQNQLFDIIEGSKLDFSVRYRHEHVDDNAATAKASASTIRSTLGYQSGKFRNFSGRLLLQDVRIAGSDNFNDSTGRTTAKTRFAIVADPSDTDLLEGYISYSGLPGTNLRLGRQIITYRDVPFHRFIGTVLWRQNWQSHDAIAIVNKQLPDTTFSYAYSWNVNRIFSEKAIGTRANFDSDSHFINLQYSGLKHGKLEFYSYLLDLDNSPVNSLATYGIRINGINPLTKKFKLLYAAEYAHQNDYGNNPENVNHNYILGELGGNFIYSNEADSFTVKINFELLSGNGSNSFKTPLATGHAFQGWADRFLTTPKDGIKDIYITFLANIFGINFTTAYHDLSSDNDHYHYGRELDLQITKRLNKAFIIGLKYSDYQADNNFLNRIRNGNIAADVSKLWLWLDFKYQ